ncbi:MAG TPA: signal peptidase I [Xanthobacteraceae bacterium]|jgi:signal peptidase I
MALMADLAASGVREHRAPSPWLAALLTVLTPGLGHLYIGQARRGITLFILILIADTLLMFAMMGVLARFWLFATSFLLLVGLWLYIVVDVVRRARRTPALPDHAQGGWATYVAAFTVACLLIAWPFFYGWRAHAAGQLLCLTANSPSMEPTIETGEFYLADASYYHARPPMRGEVVVYKHPKQPELRSIKRIVAVGGDRIAIKGGRAIVNGIALEEPYLDAAPATGSVADMQETPVPLGYVFVLGDNRANSVDSRDAVAHGPVPLDNLIGRVTDVAISRHLMRMGRWIGTPSNL